MQGWMDACTDEENRCLGAAGERCGRAPGRGLPNRRRSDPAVEARGGGQRRTSRASKGQARTGTHVPTRSLARAPPGEPGRLRVRALHLESSLLSPLAIAFRKRRVNEAGHPFGVSQAQVCPGGTFGPGHPSGVFAEPVGPTESPALRGLELCSSGNVAPTFPFERCCSTGNSRGWGRTAPPSGKAGAAHRLGRGQTPRRCARSRFAGPPQPRRALHPRARQVRGSRFLGSLGFLRPGEGCAFGVTAGEAEGAARQRDLWYFRAIPAGSTALDPSAFVPPAVGNFPTPPAALRGEKRQAPPPKPVVTTECREPARREANSPCRPEASSSRGDWKADCDAARPVIGDKCDNPVPVLRDDLQEDSC
ncbi:uncharacterized protein LOC108312919 [Cebus imitator]|uniref:uncharacterized protein LOC108312919 n=1 Tax=Cebus imitator TaxID=2715852 RepID=UPI00189A898A|nr:uncharacterized protein LOC108312919 [Cebus imitator]